MGQDNFDDKSKYEGYNSLESKTEPEQRRTQLSRPSFVIRLVVSSLLLIWFSFSAISHLSKSTLSQRPSKGNFKNPSEHGDVNFEDITPSEKLEWHPCFNGFFCARLTVPMDYHRPLTDSKDNPKVHIALSLKPGRSSQGSNFSVSPMLINPGGPGGSGAFFAIGAGGLFQKIVDPDQDILGFDPRGIGATTPKADCFAYPLDSSSSIGDGYHDEDHISGNFHRMMWQNSGLNIGTVNSSSDSLLKLDTRARTMAKLCQEKDSIYGQDSVLRYVNTPNVARDMISILDAWDEWRDGLQKEKAPCRKTAKSPVAEEETAISGTKGQLVYWGFSYGTLLGATFAAMFPERVGRVVLDGVVDADHYVSPVWIDSLLDADAIFNSFPKYCFEAGPKCALYRPEDKSPSDVLTRFDSVMNDLEENPLTLIDHNSKTPAILSKSLARQVVFAILYTPQTGFQSLAFILDLLYRGFGDALAPAFRMPGLSPFCGAGLPPYVFPDEAQIAIMCSDKRSPLNATIPVLEARYQEMAQTSSFADVWLGIVVLGCNTWSIRANDPPMRWNDHPIHVPKPINTSFPILFLSNTHDPVTPLAAGLKMSAKFPSSGFVEQKSMGHCSISAVSVCTIMKLRGYFRHGEVPGHPGAVVDGEWEKCEADEWPWHPFEGKWPDFVAARGEEGLSAAEVEAVGAAKELQEVFGRMNFFGVRADVWNFDHV